MWKGSKSEYLYVIEQRITLDIQIKVKPMSFERQFVRIGIFNDKNLCRSSYWLDHIHIERINSSASTDVSRDIWFFHSCAFLLFISTINCLIKYWLYTYIWMGRKRHDGSMTRNEKTSHSTAGEFSFTNWATKIHQTCRSCWSFHVNDTQIEALITTAFRSKQTFFI